MASAARPLLQLTHDPLRVVSSSQEARYAGHSEARALQFAMLPESDEPDPPSLHKAIMPRPAGYLWTLTNPAGLTIALRARDFPFGKYARRDARGLARRARELVVTHVSDGQLKHRGWWLSLDGQVVLLSARIRPIGQRPEAERDVRAAFRLLLELQDSLVMS
ncbi:MAG TPA: hypothetical protein VGC45_02865 [Gryllotalpicola sp.]